MKARRFSTVRSRLADYRWLSDRPAMLVWAVVVGILAAFATLLFHQGIYLLQSAFSGRSGSVVETIASLPWYGRLLVPMVGGLIAGLLLWWAGKTASGNASDYMEAVAIGDGRLSVKQGLLRSLSSLFSVASGGSIGREGAMVHLGALSASVLASFAFFTPARLRLLVACGAAGGVASAYGAPIAGALFVAEIVLGTMAIQSVGPLLIAAASAHLTLRALGDYHVIYALPNLPAASVASMAPLLLLGVAAGIAAPQFLRILNIGRAAFARTGLSLPPRLALGGLLLGAMLLVSPQVAGNGFSIVSSLLHESWAWQAVALILAGKVLATTLTVGSGAVGGVFTPTLVVGAAFGTLFGQLTLWLWPGLAVSPYLFTLVGMGAFLSAATGAPLMALLMIFEMTHSYHVVAPLMMACVVAYFVARAIAEIAMYDVTLARERDLATRQGLRHLRVADLMRPAETVVNANTPVKDALQLFVEFPVRYLYVVDDSNVYLGQIAQQDLTSMLLAQSDLQERVAGDIARLDFVEPLHPGLSVDDAQAYFVQFRGERIPVVSQEEHPKLLGVVYKSSLLEKYSAIKRSLDASSEALIEIRKTGR